MTRVLERRRKLLTCFMPVFIAAIVLAVMVSIHRGSENANPPSTLNAHMTEDWTKHSADLSFLEEPVEPMNRIYHVVSLEIPLVFNIYGDHDPNGLMFALEENEASLEAYRDAFHPPPVPLPSDRAPLFELNPLVRPLVLRCNLHDVVTIVFTNKIRNRKVGMHVAMDGHSAAEDGSAVGRNPPSLAAFGETIEYHWKCGHEGVFHFADGGNLSGTERGTNSHGLFGALVVEPFGSRWTDPHTGKEIRDGITADIHPPKLRGFQHRKAPFFGFEPELAHPSASFREHVTIFHDEPEVKFARTTSPSVCGNEVTEANGAEVQAGMTTPNIDPALHVINYRSDPLRNRESDVQDRIRAGLLERPVFGEEQHHSSWMHGDPGLVFTNYAGDPVKFRVVHGGVKETHVFHWHVHQWYAVEGKTDSPIIDSFSLSPQWAVTFTALYGAGSRLKSIGDVIFHCHLYPHFNLGMWGIFRVFDKLQDGSMTYPDGTQIKPLIPLPDRERPPRPTEEHPGFPIFIAGTFRQKSPRVPWPVERLGPIPEGSDFREAKPLEAAAMNADPQPGNFFTLNPTPRAGTIDPETGMLISPVNHTILAVNRDIEFNQYGWHDPNGHMYQLEGEERGERHTPTAYEPIVLRANNAQVVTQKIFNKFDLFIPGTVFDPPFPDCPAHPTEGEVGIHVHLVKFDVLASDGASVGWNYISGARFGRYYLNLWWADREFGHVFFHDHLFPNFRQKHGLYGILPVEPFQAQYFDPFDLKKPILTGLQAVITAPAFNNTPVDLRGHPQVPIVPNTSTQDDPSTNSLTLFPGTFREWINFIGDQQPAFTRNGVPLFPPPFPGADNDNGIFVVNYRSEPLRERIKQFRFQHGTEVDPADLFSSNVFGDPSSTLYVGYPGDALRLRIAQGAHEESHSFSAYGLRWHDLWTDPKTNTVSQQILGISKAFTKIPEQDYGPGDHLIFHRAQDDTWLGCWAIARIFDKIQPNLPPLPNNPDPFKNLTQGPQPTPENTREYKVVAESRVIDYTEGFLGEKRLDPLGLIYRLTAYKEPGADTWVAVQDHRVNPKPLVIRALEGEFVKVHLTNNINPDLFAEPNRPEVPVDLRNFRRVSQRVSMHADIVRYDVRDSDGSNIGFNPDTTVPIGETRTYTWFADRFFGGPIMLMDHADVRNHRHHGLIGALLVEPRGFVPKEWHGEQTTLRRVWTFPSNIPSEVNFDSAGGMDAMFSEEDTMFLIDEHVIMMQDGLRLFNEGDLLQPVPDFRDADDQADGLVPGQGTSNPELNGVQIVANSGLAQNNVAPVLQNPQRRANVLKHDLSFHFPNITNPTLIKVCRFLEDAHLDVLAWEHDWDQACQNFDAFASGMDPEDQGQKGLNYRSAPTRAPVWLTPDDPPTPIWEAVQGRVQMFHVTAVNDKPRAISLQFSGHVFREFANAGSIATAVDNAINPGRTLTVFFKAKRLGDWAVRAGNLHNHVAEGMWSILRVSKPKDDDQFERLVIDEDAVTTL
ncbi:hypothetical protein HK104_001167 [Borealophlyctis nickersoniae]|nr:hypothetical protein HK104_001167 [Borealophlyctis nickersoniae]